MTRYRGLLVMAIVLAALFVEKHAWAGPPTEQLRVEIDRVVKTQDVPGSARELARSAYFQIEANVFDGQEKHTAIQKLSIAEKKDPKEPFVYLAASLATLVQGYTIGDWYEAKTFVDGTLEKALSLAEKALALDANLGHSYAHLARLRIVQKEFQEAERLLSKAKEVDQASFYPWYFEGIQYEKLANISAATQAFNVAESKVTMKHQLMLLNNHRQHVAKIGNDPAFQEKLLKENIAQNPIHPYLIGNYAEFLMCQGRHAEAVVRWEKALSIATYPRAVQQLEKAKRFVAEKKKEKTCG